MTVEKISMRMKELERNVVNTRMTSETEERATHDEARTSNMGQLNFNSLESANEVEALSNSTNNQGEPVLPGEDVDMGRPGQPNRDEQAQAPEVDMSGQAMDDGRPKDVRLGKQRKRILDEDEEDFNFDEDEVGDSQFSQLDLAPLAFGGEDINMSPQRMINNNAHEQAQAPEVSMSGRAMDAGRPEDVTRRKPRRQIMDEDEEEFNFGDEGNSVDDDSDPEGVSIGRTLENRVIWLTV